MSRVLDRINSPTDLKKLTLDELICLCTEIREVLVNTVTINGGHLSSNLGVVELTVALHRVFDSPKDKIIWDVGHQSYVHKLLTGRRCRFSSLRQHSGLSGFPDPAESNHDPFIGGHASTSVSAGLGMAIARELNGEEHDIVAVIGDGALTGGMVYESLNHAGHLGIKLIVVLNDNGMSISPTVGAVAKRLNKVCFNYYFREVQARAGKFLAASRWSEGLRWILHRLKRSIKAVAMPTMFWEELGFTYVGPVDGHNIAEIEMTLRQARSLSSRPVLVHVITVKGKGYEPAEADPVRFHALSPREESCSVVVPTYSQVFAETLCDLARDNPRLVVVTAAMSEGNCLGTLARTFPRRFYDVGICEEHAVTLAAGLATKGFIPIVAIYSTFLQRAFDQILHDICLQDLPIVFAIDRSGIVGEDGKTHQGIFDLSYLTLMPNMIVSAPKDENEFRHLLNTAIHAGHPMAIRYPRGCGVGVALSSELEVLPVGKGEIIKHGSDIALLAIGSAVRPALEASYRLSDLGVDTTVVNARFAKPLDSELILDIAATVGNMVTIEENILKGGFGSAVLELLAASHMPDVKLRRIGIPDEFVEHGPQNLIRSRYKLDAQGITETSMAFLFEHHQQPIIGKKRA